MNLGELVITHSIWEAFVHKMICLDKNGACQGKKQATGGGHFE